MWLLLAQGTEAAKETVDLLTTILQGGPLLILAVLVVIQGYVIYHLFKRTSKLESDFRESSVSLLRDQIAQAQPLTEALTKTNTVLDRVDMSLKNAQETMTRLNAKLDAQERVN